MSKLTLDEAIKHCLEVAENCEEQANQCDSDDRYERHVMHENAKCAADHRQLAEWLTELKELRSIVDACNILAVDAFAVENLCKELKEAKELLKAAVEDMTGMQFGEECKVCSKKLLPNECPIHNNLSCILGKDFKWRYADEALKLIGEEGGNNAQNTFQRQEPQR